MRTIYILLSSLLLSSLLQAQDMKLVKCILRQQKFYYHQSIPKHLRKNYKIVFMHSKIVIPELFKEVNRNDSAFFLNKGILNLIEGYNPNATVLHGIIWKSNDSDVLVYNFDWSSSSIKIKKISRRSLGFSGREIIENYCDWNNTIFSHMEENMFTPSDGSYYLGSKYSATDAIKVKAIAFYQYPL